MEGETMNLWECGEPGCHRTVVGAGSAIGLRAIGWYWGGMGSHYIRCPVHRPDSVPCHDLYPDGGDHCPLCAAEDEAARWQLLMTERPASAPAAE